MFDERYGQAMALADIYSRERRRNSNEELRLSHPILSSKSITAYQIGGHEVGSDSRWVVPAIFDQPNATTSALHVKLFTDTSPRITPILACQHYFNFGYE